MGIIMAASILSSFPYARITSCYKHVHIDASKISHSQVITGKSIVMRVSLSLFSYVECTWKVHSLKCTSTYDRVNFCSICAGISNVMDVCFPFDKFIMISFTNERVTLIIHTISVSQCLILNSVSHKLTLYSPHNIIHWEPFINGSIVTASNLMNLMIYFSVLLYHNCDSSDGCISVTVILIYDEIRI